MIKMSKEEINKAKFWDKVASVYSIFTNLVNGRVHAKLKKLIEEQVNSTDKVLECACGNGMITEDIARKCKQVVATDVSKKMLVVAEKKLKKYRNIKWEEGDILNISYADNTFDKVIAGNVIHLLDDPAKAVKELVRVCVPNGTVIIPTYMNKREKKPKTIIKNINNAGADFKQYFSLDTYKEFFINEGYSNVEVKYIEGKIPNAIAIIKKQ